MKTNKSEKGRNKGTEWRDPEKKHTHTHKKNPHRDTERFIYRIPIKTWN